MKPLISTCLVLCAVACGSGGQGPAENRYHPDTTPTSQAQVPTRPGDSVPPLNSQQPPIGSQTPPSNTQSAGPAAVTISCDAILVAANRAGCAITDDFAAGCKEVTIAGYRCAAQVQNLFVCLLQHPVCDDNGELNVLASCPEQTTAYRVCLNLEDNQTVGSCTRDSQCRNCPDACSRCICQANDGAAVERCANDCIETN